MKEKEKLKFEELLDIPKSIDFTDFDNYIIDFLNRKADKNLAIQELDQMLAKLQNYISTLSLYLKQNHLLKNRNYIPANQEMELYTKHEVAAKFRVSIRTVTNWIIDGLETIEIGGVKRISNAALLAFTKMKRTKKFNWRSITR